MPGPIDSVTPSESLLALSERCCKTFPDTRACPLRKRIDQNARRPGIDHLGGSEAERRAYIQCTLSIHRDAPRSSCSPFIPVLIDRQAVVGTSTAAWT